MTSLYHCISVLCIRAKQKNCGWSRMQCNTRVQEWQVGEISLHQGLIAPPATKSNNQKPANNQTATTSNQPPLVSPTLSPQVLYTTKTTTTIPLGNTTTTSLSPFVSFITITSETVKSALRTWSIQAPCWLIRRVSTLLKFFVPNGYYQVYSWPYGQASWPLVITCLC